MVLFNSRLSLTSLPTPLEALPTLSRQLGVELWIKRDDLTSPAGGGNKVRKLEFLLADANSRKATAVITLGAVQSNHCRQTALLAAKLGHEAHLVLIGEEPIDRQGNLLLDTLSGATLHFGARTLEEGRAIAQQLMETLRASGKEPYLIPYGGSDPIGVQGYVAAWAELQEQAQARSLSFDCIVHASSSGGTQAGLLVGQQVYGGSGQVIGISVGPPATTLAREVAALAGQTAQAIGLDSFSLSSAPIILDQYIGPGYALLDETTYAAIRRLAQTEAILLDPVYTGKAFTGFLRLASEGRLGKRALFWHTGGAPALYSYADQLTSSQPAAA